MVKDILRSVTDFDLVCTILLTKPKNKEGIERFDAKKLYEAIRDSSKKYKELGRLFRKTGTDGSVPSAFCDSTALDTMFSVLRMGYTIGQFQDELHTEIYYLRKESLSVLAKELENRLGKSFLEKLDPMAQDVWNSYASKRN